jgi:predicted acylesterase/phospholipase RssA
MYTSLVIGGAGSKNYASIGALKTLGDKLVNVKRILGVSSGSVIGTLLAVGCNPDEIEHYYSSMDFSEFKVKYSSWYTYYKIFRKNGIYDSGIFREKVIHKMLESKTGNGCITFKQIFLSYGITLVIPAACVNRRETFYYQHISNPDMPVKFAIERSCCVPGLFQPIKHKGNTFVDAGVIDNFPLYFFSDEDNTPNSKITKVIFQNQEVTSSTLGILIVNKNTSRLPDTAYLGDDLTDTLQDYIKSLMNTLLTTNERLHIKDDYWQKTLAIDIGDPMDGVSSLELDEITKKNLYQKGVEAATEFLEDSKSVL